MSYEGDGSVAVPTWVVSEPGPVGTYPSYTEALEAGRGWAEGDPATRTYVLINNLGCAQ